MSNDENTRVLEALERLQVSLQQLPAKQNPPRLSHWRRLPEAVQSAHDYIQKGAELCKAASTKYTLVGKINAEEGAKLAKDLLQGCEWIATGTLVLCNDESGCCRFARYTCQQAARAVVSTTLELVHVFATHHEHDNETIAAQRTGAVWNTCDALLKIPQGNRNAIRRQVFTLVMECNDTLEEFTQLVELGASSTNNNDNEEETTWDDFCESQQPYSASELPIAAAALSLVKCWRKSLQVTLNACESVGNAIEGGNNESINNNGNKEALLEWIKTLSNLAVTAGDGITDLGTCLYPPLDLTSKASNESDLEACLSQQRDALVTLNEFVLDAPTELPEDVLELASKLKGAATTRYNEAQNAISTALQEMK